MAMRERGVNLTDEERAYIEEMARLTGRKQSAVIRTAIHNLWELTQAMEKTNGDLKAYDVLYEFMTIDRNFSECYARR